MGRFFNTQNDAAHAALFPIRKAVQIFNIQINFK